MSFPRSQELNILLAFYLFNGFSCYTPHQPPPPTTHTTQRKHQHTQMHPLSTLQDVCSQRRRSVCPLVQGNELKLVSTSANFKSLFSHCILMECKAYIQSALIMISCDSQLPPCLQWDLEWVVPKPTGMSQFAWGLFIALGAPPTVSKALIGLALL